MEVKHNEKNLLKDILVFVVITVAASLSLAMVNSITKDPIARQNEKSYKILIEVFLKKVKILIIINK